MKKYLYQATCVLPAEDFLRFPSENLRVKVSPVDFFNSKHSFIWRLSAIIGGKLSGNSGENKFQFLKYQLYRDEKMVAEAEVATRMPAFPFMTKNEIYIGSCRTILEERGRGYYPYLIASIEKDFPEMDYCMFVDEGNEASVRGVEKAGFQRVATLAKTKFGFYLIEKRL